MSDGDVYVIWIIGIMGFGEYLGARLTAYLCGQYGHIKATLMIEELLRD